MSPTAVRRSARMSLLAIAVGLASLVLADPADAHSALVSSDPADGSTVRTPIERVDLTFSEAPLTGLDAGLRIEVRDEAGTDVSTGDVLVDGTTMSKAVALRDGAYTVLWRYVSPDGHPITGELGFTAMLPAPTSTAVSTPDPSTPDPSPGPTEVEVTLEASAPAAAPDDGPTPWGAVWVGGGAIVLAAALVVVATLRRRAPPEGGEGVSD
ncbi:MULTISPECIES: copper resistance protein CopC [unclassified Curtobacterium]|uniref:copper resistance CopC family protein n=1 Tax=unclassified Curtobacterium TaxID=257496 RepID=UPI0037FF3039